MSKSSVPPFSDQIRAPLVQKLLELRQEKGLTQMDLEKLSGVKQPVIARLENGTTDPQLSTIVRLASSLGCSLTLITKEE